MGGAGFLNLQVLRPAIAAAFPVSSETFSRAVESYIKFMLTNTPTGYNLELKSNTPTGYIT
jgi:hypothetical protein